MKSVLFLTNIPAPYTVDFFNELGKYVNLFVVFEDKNSLERDASWSFFSNIRFQYCILSELDSGKEKTKRVKEEISKKYDLRIVGNYSTKIGMQAIMYLRTKRLPYCIHADGGFIKKDNIIKFSLKKFLISGAKYYFSSGKETSKYFTHYGADANRIIIYPFTSIRANMINEPLRDVASLKEELGVLEEKVVVSIGRIIPIKGFDILLKAKARISEEIGLYIIGGQPTEELEKLIQDLELKNVHFIDFVPFTEAFKYLMIADVFAFTSRGDVWGLVINEAMAAGAPIVSTDGAVAAVEILEPGKNGYIVPTDDIGKLSDAINCIISDNELRLNMKINNVKKASIYTIENMAKVYFEGINQATEC